MRKSPRTFAVAALVGGIVSLSAGLATAQYSPVDLGTLGGVFSVAHDINKRGQIVGRASLPSGEQHAFLWEHGVMQDLGTLPGGHFSEAFAINDRGQIAGWSDLDQSTCTLFDGCWHAFLWVDGAMTDLGGIDSRFQSYAYDINKGGDIAGIGNTADYPNDSWHALLWVDGVPNDLGSPAGATNAFARGVNDRGEAAGSWFDGAGAHAGVWTRRGFFALPALPGDTYSEAYKINNRGVVVGVSQSHAVQWIDGVIQDLGVLPGDDRSTATDVNSRGEVVGYSFSGSTGYRAFVWSDGVMTPLPTPIAGGASQANGLNDRGDIVGMWDHGSAPHAIVWIKQ
jgi:probable HAF family extracellular repeat protein